MNLDLPSWNMPLCVHYSSILYACNAVQLLYEESELFRDGVVMEGMVKMSQCCFLL